MTADNTRINSKGWKLCKACRSAADKRDREKFGDARRAKVRKWHAENKDRVSEHHKIARQRISDAIIEAKENKPCTDCGGIFPSCCMDFDHVSGDKSFNIGACKNLARLTEEMTKCELVCANCHRIRTFMSGRERPWEKKAGRKPLES